MIWFLFLITIYLLMLVASFFFSGSETGYVCLNKEEHKKNVDQKNKSAILVKPFVEKMEIVLGVTLLGNNLSNISATYVGEILWFNATNDSPVIFFSIISTVIFLIFAEILPKFFFKRYTRPLVYGTAKILVVFHFVFRPLVFLLTQISSFLVNPFLVRKRNKLSREDWNALMDDFVEEGIFKEEELDFINTLSSLSKIKATEVMTPLVDLYFVNKSQNIVVMEEEIFRDGRDWIFVYENRIDKIVGLIDTIDIFKSKKTKKISKDLMKEATYFPENNTLDDLYSFFATTDAEAVVFVDEYGGCTGIVSKKDLLDYLFGFHNKNGVAKRSEGKLIKKRTKKEYDIDGFLGMDAFNKYFLVDLPKRDHQTIGGYVSSLFGYIPKEGEVKTYGSFSFRVLKSGKTGVAKIRVNFL